MGILHLIPQQYQHCVKYSHQAKRQEICHVVSSRDGSKMTKDQDLCSNPAPRLNQVSLDS